MSKQMKKYCIIGKIVCNLAKVFGVVGFYAIWTLIFVYAFVG